MAPATPVSVIIPAHDEGAQIGRLLKLLTAGGDGRDVDIVVACNACTDDTAAVARTFSGVSVVDIPEASKRRALEAGDAVARHPIRAYVDADIGLTRADLLTLVDALDDGTHVVAPERHLALERSARSVRWYYDVWQRLPQVREGVFGRGTIVMSPEGHRRVRELPFVMSDDLAISEAFRPSERRVISGTVSTIEAPRTLRELIRRRVRVATGNSQLEKLGMRSEAARTSASDLLRIASQSPTLPLKVAVFSAVAIAARLAARRRVRAGDFSTWLRDESSRRA